MALPFTKFSWLWRGAKDKEQGPKNSTINPSNSGKDWGLGLRGEPESLKFESTKRGGDRKVPSSTRKSKRKWKKREVIDREYDMVLVPSDGVCLSGSESDDSDWSVGWLEPHPPHFKSFDDEDDDDDHNFAVLVPCYSRHDSREMEENDYLYGGGGKEQYMEQWLSSLQSL